MKGNSGKGSSGMPGFQPRPGWLGRWLYAVVVLTVVKAFSIPQSTTVNGNSIAVCGAVGASSNAPATKCCQAIRALWPASRCTTSGDGNWVQTLSLSNCGLTGQVDPALGQNLFSKMTRLDLSRNQLQGVIPPIVIQSSLTYLDLSSNQFAGNVPSAIFTSPPNLQTLKLNNNRYTGGLNVGQNANIGMLTNLVTLDLSFNQQLQVAIPSPIGNLQALQFLYLQNCGFVGQIPQSLGSLSSLKRLNLGGNQLAGTIPPQVIRNLRKLTQLTLRNQGSCRSNSRNTNCLGGTIPSEIGRLAKLRNLDLSGNRLTGSIPDSIQNNIALRNLYLGSNRLSGNVPQSLGLLSKLTFLDISNNRLSGTIPSMVNLVRLTWINLSNNFRISGSVGCTPRYISTNQGSRSQSNTPQFYAGGSTSQQGNNMPAVLAHIDFSHNAMDGGLCGRQLNQINSLTYLNVGSNALSGPIPTSFPSGVTYLNLANNQFTGAIPNLSSLQNLHVLNIGRNPTLSCSGLKNYGNWASSQADFSSYYGQTCANVQRGTTCPVLSARKCGQRARARCPRHGSFPPTLAGTLATGKCRPGYFGRITKVCRSNGRWERQTRMNCRRGCSRHSDCNTGANSQGGVSRGPQFCFNCRLCLRRNNTRACGSCARPSGRRGRTWRMPMGECQTLSQCTVGRNSLYQSINGFCPGVCPMRGSWPVSRRGQTVRISCPSGYTGHRIRRCLSTGRWERRTQYTCVKGCNTNGDCNPSQYCMSCSKCLRHRNVRRCGSCLSMSRTTSQKRLTGECQALSQCLSRYRSGKADSTNTGGTCPGGCKARGQWPSTQSGATARITCAQGGATGWVGYKTRRCGAPGVRKPNRGWNVWQRRITSSCVRGCNTHADCSSSQYCMICRICLANYPVISGVRTLTQQAAKCGRCAKYRTRSPKECGPIRQCITETRANKNSAVNGVCPHFCPAKRSHLGGSGRSKWPMTRVGASARLACRSGYYGDVIRRCCAPGDRSCRGRCTTTTQGNKVGCWARNQYRCRRGGRNVAPPSKIPGYSCAWQADGHRFFFGSISGSTQTVVTRNATVQYQLSMCNNGHTLCANAGLAQVNRRLVGDNAGCLINLGAWSTSVRADTPVGHYRDNDGIRLLFNNGQTCTTRNSNGQTRQQQTNTIVNFICARTAPKNRITSVRARQVGPCNYVFDVYTRCACNNGCTPSSGMRLGSGAGAQSSGSSAGVAILIFLIIAIIGVAAYFYYKKSMLEKEMFELEYAKMEGDSSAQA